MRLRDDGHVASHTEEPLAWPNSARLIGDVPKAVHELKVESGNELHSMGSGVLIRSLISHGLIDEYMLMIHPVVLDSRVGSSPTAVLHRLSRW
jgi:dihydrofolate reductase